MLQRIIINILLILSLVGLIAGPALAALKTADEWNDMGIEALDKQDYDSAINYFNKALKLDQENPTTYFNRGAAYMYTQSYSNAIDDYTSALKYVSDKDKGTIYAVRGVAYQANKMKKEAIADYKKALTYKLSDEDRKTCIAKLEELGVDTTAKEDTNNQDALNDYMTKGLKAYEAGQLDKAIRYFNQAIEISPETYELYAMRGVCYMDKEDFAKVIPDCDKVIELNPGDKKILAKAYYSRAYSNIQLGNTDKLEGIMTDLISTIENNKYHYPAYDLLIVFAKEVKKYDIALQLANRKADAAEEEGNDKEYNDAKKQAKEIKQIANN